MQDQLLEKLLVDSSLLDNEIKHKYIKPYKGRQVIFINIETLSDLVKGGEIDLSHIEIKVPLVINNLTLNEHGYQCIKNVTFFNCKNVDIEVSGGSNISGLNVHDCTDINVLVSDSNIGDDGITISGIKEKISQDNTIVCRVNLNNVNCNGLIFLHDLSEVVSLRVKESNFTLDDKLLVRTEHKYNIVLENLEVESSYIDSTVLNNGIISVNVKFLNEIRVLSKQRENIQKLIFIDCPKIMFAELYGFSTAGIYFVLCKDIQSLTIGDLHFFSNDIIERDTFHNFKLSPYTISKFEFGKFKSSFLELNEIKCKELLISNCTSCDTLSFTQCNISSGYISSTRKLNKLLFSKTLSPDSSLIIDSLSCKELVFENFINSGFLYLKSLKAEDNTEGNLFKIIDSDLGNTHFISCRMKDGWEYGFLNSNILQINIVASFFPDKSEESTVELQKRILFSQLHQIYESSGSRIRSILYRKLALESYYKHLKELITNRKYEGRSVDKKSVKWKDRWDYLALSLHKISSDFDYKLNRAVLCLLGFTLLFYLLYIWSLDYYCLSASSTEDWKRFVNLFANFFVFLSPIHKTNFINKVGSSEVIIGTSWTVLVDSLAKIVTSYLIYQMVQSFRKFGKR